MLLWPWPRSRIPHNHHVIDLNLSSHSSESCRCDLHLCFKLCTIDLLWPWFDCTQSNCTQSTFELLRSSSWSRKEQDRAAVYWIQILPSLPCAAIRECLNVSFKAWAQSCYWPCIMSSASLMRQALNFFPFKIYAVEGVCDKSSMCFISEAAQCIFDDLIIHFVSFNHKDIALLLRSDVLSIRASSVFKSWTFKMWVVQLQSKAFLLPDEWIVFVMTCVDVSVLLPSDAILTSQC